MLPLRIRISKRRISHADIALWIKHDSECGAHITGINVDEVEKVL